MRKLVYLLLMALIIFAAGCENATESTANTLASSSGTEESITDIIDTIPDVQYDYSVYERFTPTEIANMVFSQKGIFSYTTDYYRNLPVSLAVGDALEVEFKLTNMTNQTFTVIAVPPPKVVFNAEKNENPAATSWEAKFTFEPYETKSFYFELTVTDDLTEYNGYYRFRSFAGIDIYEPNNIKTDADFSRFSMMIQDLPIQIKKEE